MHKQMHRTLIVMIGKTQAKRLIESPLGRRGYHLIRSSGAYGLEHFFLCSGDWALPQNIY
jgi:hypothetical protein